MALLTIQQDLAGQSPRNSSRTMFHADHAVGEPLRRAKSLGDFHHNVRQQMRAENQAAKSRRPRRQSENDGDAEIRASRATLRLSTSSHAPFILYRQQLAQTQTHLDQLLRSAKQTLTELTDLSTAFDAVDAQTTDFQAECETLVAEQQKTGDLAEQIASNLQFYDYLEPITRRLNAPGAGALVRRSEFPKLLSNLDACLEYMGANKSQKEAAAYESKYRLLLTRGLTLIRNQFTSSIREIVTDINQRVVERKLNDTSTMALLYAKFKSSASDLRPMTHEISLRVNATSARKTDGESEYQGLLDELHQSFVTSRTKLLQPLIARRLAEMEGIAAPTSDLVSFVHTCTNFMRSLCSDEHALWAEWFDNDYMLYPFLESLCESMHDRLRPRIIRETKINKLCDVCSLIQVRYGSESESESEEEEERKLDFGRLVQPALQDAQDRLVFLAQASIRTDIQLFKPKSEDLDYPRKAHQVVLSGNRAPAMLSGRKHSNGNSIPSNPLALEEDAADRDFGIGPSLQGFYPTLRKAVWLLSRLYRLVQPTVFDSLAHEVVYQNTLSLEAAASQIATRVSPTDSNLFLLSHYLALKHQILSFDIDSTDVDNRTDSSTLWDLRDGIFNPSSWYRALGAGFAPRVSTDMKDARTELDTRLRTVIGELVGAWSTRMADPIVRKAEINGEEKRGRTDERKKLTTYHGDVETGTNLRSTIEREVPLVRDKLEEYLHDQRTRDMLLRAVLEDVLVKYAAWLEARGLDTTGHGRTKGKGRENSVWEEEAFAEWAVGAFGLDPTLMNDHDNDDSDA